MFRILLVDDEPFIRESHREELSKPSCIHVDAARNVEEGDRYIRAALRQKRPYDGALLDFRFPSTDHERQDEWINQSLCEALRNEMNNCFVLHMTGLRNDPQVEAHMTRFHSGLRGSHADVVKKDDSTARLTCKKLLDFVVSRHMHQLLDRLFVPRPVLRGSGFIPSGLPHLSASHQLAELQYVVQKLYGFLDSEALERLEFHFNVELESKKLAFLPRVG